MEIRARARRDGRWWVVELPINGVLQATQGRTLAEAQFMAEDLTATWAEELSNPELAHAQVILEIDGAARATAASAE